MNVLYNSIYVSIIIWFIIPFRQLNQRYFYYFLLFALLDPINLGLKELVHMNTNILFIPFSFLALVTVQEVRFIKKYWLIILIIFPFIFVINLNGLSNFDFFILMSLIHFLIFLKLIKDFVVNIVKNNLFDIFLLVLVFYELTVITKFLNLLSGFTDANIYFIITTTFEILIGLFFCIFKSDDNKLLLQLK